MNIKLSVRLVIIKHGKVLLVNNQRDNFHYFIGGGIEFAETLDEAAARELKEETGFDDINLNILKTLYTLEMLLKDRHKFEIYVLADINKFEELEGHQDAGHGGDDHLTWVDLNNLPEDLLPNEIAMRLNSDYEEGFESINLPFYTEDKRD